MKLYRTKRITTDEADRLIERYYEGFTTVDEEKLIQVFLAQQNLPERYKPEQAIFGFFEAKKQKTTIAFQPYLHWVGSAVAVLVIVMSIQFFNKTEVASYAYVNGVKTTNIHEIKSQALASLGDVSADNNEVETSLENLNDTKLMQSQLGVFSELGN